MRVVLIKDHNALLSHYLAAHHQGQHTHYDFLFHIHEIISNTYVILCKDTKNIHSSQKIAANSFFLFFFQRIIA